jgi:hypothetical protein
MKQDVKLPASRAHRVSIRLLDTCIIMYRGRKVGVDSRENQLHLRLRKVGSYAHPFGRFQLNSSLARQRTFLLIQRPKTKHTSLSIPLDPLSANVLASTLPAPEIPQLHDAGYKLATTLSARLVSLQTCPLDIR